MIQILTGSNTFELSDALRRAIDAFVAEFGDFGVEQLDGEEVDYDRIREALESVPFLASKKLVVLRSPSANKQFIENAERLLGAVGDEIDVIIIETKLDKRLSYFKFLKKQPGFREFLDLDENGLAAWLSRQAAQDGGNLTLADARYLITRVGSNQQRLANELQKLITYSAKINRAIIDLMTEPSPQSSIFDLLDAAFAGRKNDVLALYAEQRIAKVEPQQILAMIAWQLHILALIKTAGGRDPAIIAKDARLNPYVVRKSMSIARAMTPEMLRSHIRNALSLDMRLKSEPIDADDALQNYLMSISA